MDNIHNVQNQDFIVRYYRNYEDHFVTVTEKKNNVS